MLPHDVPAAVLLQFADGAPAAPTPPMPAPLRRPRGRKIELPSRSLSLTGHPLFHDTAVDADRPTHLETTPQRLH